MLRNGRRGAGPCRAPGRSAFGCRQRTRPLRYDSPESRDLRSARGRGQGERSRRREEPTWNEMAPAQKKGSADKTWTQRGASPVEGDTTTAIARTLVPNKTSATAMIRRPTPTTDESGIGRVSVFGPSCSTSG